MSFIKAMDAKSREKAERRQVWLGGHLGLRVLRGHHRQGLPASSHPTPV